jgi:hypothetical protein
VVEVEMTRIVPRLSCAAALIAMTALVGAGPASAGPPDIVRVQFDDSFHDDFLTEECGVDVTTTATGRSTTITATRQGARLIEVHAINVGLIATAGDNTFRFRDVGADVTRIEPDGTVVLSIIGQLPFDFTGVLKVNPVTGEVILEPHHGVDTTRACAALTA